MEPSFGLAPNIRTEVFRSIHQINEGGLTIILVEQSTTRVAEFANRVYLMEDGRITFEGGKDEACSDEHVRKAFLGI
jgi:branched-chain amino acid transport system ATP-binding protein